MSAKPVIEILPRFAFKNFDRLTTEICIETHFQHKSAFFFALLDTCLVDDSCGQKFNLDSVLFYRIILNF